MVTSRAVHLETPARRTEDVLHDYGSALLTDLPRSSKRRTSGPTSHCPLAGKGNQETQAGPEKYPVNRASGPNPPERRPKEVAFYATRMIPPDFDLPKAIESR
jgi:hypothetical protein